MTSSSKISSLRLLLHSRKHAEFIKNSSLDTETIEYALTEHLRLSGMYWGLTAHKLLVMNKNNQEDKEDKEEEENARECDTKHIFSSLYISRFIPLFFAVVVVVYNNITEERARL